MSKIIKIVLCVILIMLCFYTVCYAIDEAELYNTTNTAVTNTNDNSIQNQVTAEASILSSQPTTQSNAYSSTSDSYEPSTTVSSVNSVSEASPISNILSIVLIVVGLLLILLAIAILIRLKN